MALSSMALPSSNIPCPLIIDDGGKVHHRKDFFSRLEEDYSERGNDIMSKRSPTKPLIKRIPDRRKALPEKQHSEEKHNPHEKKKMVNNLISDLLDQAYTGGILPLPECSALDRRVPKSMPAPNGFISSLDPEDESLFRYFCFGKPSVWISTKKFNRDIPWCLYGQSQANRALRHAVLAKSATHVSRIRGEPTIRAFVHLDRALPLIQQSLASAAPDEALISAVFYVMLTECSFGEFHKVHNHLRGISLMFNRVLNASKGEPSPLLQYIAESAGYLDTLPGLLGWPLAIPDSILPTSCSWLKHLMVTPESKRWIQLDFQHVEFQRQVARYKYWALSMRSRSTHTEEDETKVKQEGLNLLSDLQEWQRTHIPPYYEEPLSPRSTLDSFSDTSTEVINTRRFLHHSRFQFEAPLHAEIHLLFYTLCLITTFIIHPVPGSMCPQRVELATQFCQCIAAMGESPSSLAPETRTWGQFCVRLTFDDTYPAERDWAIDRYHDEFHFSIIELRPIFYIIRDMIEAEWGVNWNGGRNPK